MTKYLHFLLVAYLLVGCQSNFSHSEVPEFSSIAHATDFAKTDTLEASNEKPEQMPVLSDTSSYESLKNHLTDLRKYLLDNRQLRDSIIPNFWELCPIYFDMYRQNRSERANRVHEIVSDLPETNSINYRFIKSMVSHQDSSSMTYAKPLSAVFQGVTDRTSLFQTDITAAPEKEFLDNIKAHPATQVVRPSMMKSTTSYPYTDRKDSVFVYTQKERYKTSLLSFNYLSGSCRSYFYYELGAVSDKPDAEKILMASSMSLKLEYYQNDEIDEILFNAFPDICIDCPSSARFQKVFARLKGYENFYFTYTQEPQKELDDTYVPQRSLIYYDGDLLHTIWTTGVDLFGCSCL